MMSILTCLHDGVALGNDLAIGQLVPGDRNARGRQNYRLEHAELAHRLAGWQDGQAGGVGLQLAGVNEYCFKRLGQCAAMTYRDPAPLASHASQAVCRPADSATFDAF